MLVWTEVFDEYAWYFVQISISSDYESYDFFNSLIWGKFCLLLSECWFKILEFNKTIVILLCIIMQNWVK